MQNELDKVLGLVGRLRDEDGDDTARERFRNYLRADVTEVGVLQDFVETAIRETGPQYDRALQDLVNRLGELLGFEVEYGRYSGTVNQIGFDGHWMSSDAVHMVVEVKTTEAFAIKTAALLGYVNELISEGRMAADATCLGLYVVGKLDDDLRQLERAIRGEGRQSELRVITCDSLLKLAGLHGEYDLSHKDVVSLLLPTEPLVDPTIDLIANLVAQAGEEERRPRREETEVQEEGEEVPGEGEPSYYLTPINWKGHDSPMDVVGDLLTAKKYAFSERTPFRKHFKAGDWLAFYGGSGFGVFAHARLATAPRHQPLPAITRDPDQYPWIVELDNVRIYEDDAISITRALRENLDAFEDADPDANWGWMVTATSKLTEHDFGLLTRD